MDSLYLTGLPDSLSLQEMLDCDIKTEMDVDDCFSLGDLPPLALDDSLDAKWELIDSQTSGNGVLFSRISHSPSTDMTMWFNAGSSGASGTGTFSSLDIDPTMMVNPSSVMPFTTAPLQTIKPTPIVATAPSTVVTPSAAVTTVSTVTSTHVSSVPSPVQQTHSVISNSATRAKISRTNSINIVCNQNSTPIAIVRARSLSTAAQTGSINATTTLAQADSNTGVQVRSPAPVRSKVPPVHIQAEYDTKSYPKPAYSYSCLIALALKNSANGSLPVSEIYNFMCEHFPYFKTAPNGWKNSVRHNLSLNKCFEKIEKPSGNGSQRKGCLWAMNPAKTSKMDEEVQKWSRKDPHAIRRAMVIPEQLEMLERGEMKRELPSSSTHSGGEDTEDTEDEDEDCAANSPPVSPPSEQPFTPPRSIVHGLEVDPIADEEEEGEGDQDEFVDISSLSHLDNQNLSDFDIDVNDGLYEDLAEEKLNLGINITAPGKIQGNYIYKPSPNKLARTNAHTATVLPIQSYVCKQTNTSTAVRIRKVQPAILLSSVAKRQHI